MANNTAINNWRKLQNITRDHFDGKEYTIPTIYDSGKTKDVVYLPGVYADDQTNDDEGNFGYQVRIMLGKKGVLGTIQRLSGLGELSGAYVGDLILRDSSDVHITLTRGGGLSATREDLGTLVERIESEFETNVDDHGVGLSQADFFE